MAENIDSPKAWVETPFKLITSAKTGDSVRPPHPSHSKPLTLYRKTSLSLAPTKLLLK